MAVISSNPLIRGVATAMAWVVPRTKAKAFKTTEVELALEWLSSITVYDVVAARECIHRAWREVPLMHGLR